MPHAPIPLRVVVWSVMCGLAVTLPVLWVLSLLPGLAPSAHVMEFAAQRIAELYQHPGGLALKALLIYPVIEEIVYRGLVMQLLRRYAPGWVAVTATSAFFAITHIGGGLHNVIFAFAMGLVFSWLVIRTGSLYASMLCHATVNLTVLFVLHPIFGARGYFSSADFYHVMPIALLVTSFGLMSSAVRILRRETALTDQTATA